MGGIARFFLTNSRVCSPVSVKNEIGIGLTNLVQQARFKDWLFIFGTVIAINELDEADETNQTQYEYLNFAPIYKGFDPDETSSRGMRFLAPKRYVSGIDFLIPAERVGSGAVVEPDGALYNNDLFVQLADWLLKEYDYAMIYNSFFVMNGITMNLEICLDHANQFAMKSFVALMNADNFTIPIGGNGRLEHAPLLGGADFSIITSAGMTIYKDNLVLVCVDFKGALITELAGLISMMVSIMNSKMKSTRIFIPAMPVCAFSYAKGSASSN